MKLRHVIAGCLASLALSDSLVQSLSACERCRGAHACSVCQPADDRGLLDRLDSILQCRRPVLPPMVVPRLPALNGNLCCTLSARAVCRCGAGPGCGCELNEPGCGCELHEPGCGCELHEPNCGVEMSAVAGHPKQHSTYSELGAANSHQQAAPIVERHKHAHQNQKLPSLPPAAPEQIEKGELIGQPKIDPYRGPAMHRDSSSPPAAVERDSYRVQPLVPVPQVAPLPDSEVDPFRDESATRVRRLPARPVQHRQSQGDYRQSFDPQARHESVRISLSDDGLSNPHPASARPSQSPTGVAQAQPRGLDPHGSSRLRGGSAVEPNNANQARLPEVVTASGQTATNRGDARFGEESASRSRDVASSGEAVSRKVEHHPNGAANPLRSINRYQP